MSAVRTSTTICVDREHSNLKKKVGGEVLVIEGEDGIWLARILGEQGKLDQGRCLGRVRRVSAARKFLLSQSLAPSSAFRLHYQDLTAERGSPSSCATRRVRLPANPTPAAPGSYSGRRQCRYESTLAHDRGTFMCYPMTTQFVVSKVGWSRNPRNHKDGEVRD